MIATWRRLACDHPTCFSSLSATEHEGAADLRRRAALDGWGWTEQAEDLCPHHADVRRGRPPQMPLFGDAPRPHGGEVR